MAIICDRPSRLCVNLLRRRHCKRALSPVHTSNNVEATVSVAVLGNNVEATFDLVKRTKFQRKTRSTLLPFLATKSTL